MMLQEFPTVNCAAVQLAAWLLKSPVADALVTVNGPVPLLVTTTLEAELVVLSVWPANVSWDAGERLVPGVGTYPVPVRASVRPMTPDDVTWNVPAGYEMALLGLKETVAVQLALSANVVPQVPAPAMKPELAVNLRFVRLPIAVMVMGIVELVVLTAWEPNAIGTCVGLIVELIPVAVTLRFRIGS
jgi:hypothetical protein